jgi:hypothetical protein
MCWTVQRNLRGGYDGAPTIRIRDKRPAFNCSGWLPCALRDGTSTYHSKGERDDYCFSHHCDFLFASSAEGGNSTKETE